MSSVCKTWSRALFFGLALIIVTIIIFVCVH